MKSMAFLAQEDHNRKAAIYAAAHDGKLRNFAYTEELGECRETFSRLLHAVQEGEIGVILTPEAACLAIETSPGWMETFIQAVKQREVLIGDHSHELVYDLRNEEDEARFRGLYSPGDYEQARSAPRPLADAIAQSPDAMEPHRASLPQGAHVRVILPESGQARSKQSRKRRGGKR